MKAITTDAIITSISSKQDRSLSLRVVTPELSHEEKVVVMELQGMNTKMLIEPVDEEASGIMSVQKPMNIKTQRKIRRRWFMKTLATVLLMFVEIAVYVFIMTVAWSIFLKGVVI